MPITLEVLGEKIDSLRELNDTQHKMMIEHQKITNGRVNKLEAWKDNLPKEMEKDFAHKRVEKNFDKVVMLVLTGVVIGVLNLVLK